MGLLNAPFTKDKKDDLKVVITKKLKTKTNAHSSNLLLEFTLGIYSSILLHLSLMDTIFSP